LIPSLIDKIRHITNPLHVYCRMRSIGIPAKIALWISRIYEALYMF